MSIINIDRKTTLDLEQFLYVWFNALPENHPRIKINIGQRVVEFPILFPLTTDEIGFFDKPVEGKLIVRVPITGVWSKRRNLNVPLPIKVNRGDRIIYHLNWDSF